MTPRKSKKRKLGENVVIDRWFIAMVKSISIRTQNISANLISQGERVKENGEDPGRYTSSARNADNATSELNKIIQTLGG